MYYTVSRVYLTPYTVASGVKYTRRLGSPKNLQLFVLIAVCASVIYRCFFYRMFTSVIKKIWAGICGKGAAIPCPSHISRNGRQPATERRENYNIMKHFSAISVWFSAIILRFCCGFRRHEARSDSDISKFIDVRQGVFDGSVLVSNVKRHDNKILCCLFC